jgi:hypothetical protein
MIGTETAQKEQVPDRYVTPAVSCAKLRLLEQGEKIEGLLRGRGRVQVFSVAKNIDVGASVRHMGVPDCSYADRTCRDRRDVAMLAGRAGKAFDGPAGHKPAGSPCAIGLPCGLVLAPTQPWQLRLEEPRAADAVLQIAALRIATGSIDVPVTAGRAELAPGFVRAGASYSYALKTRAGEVIAAGQFSVASAGIEADVRAAEAAALAAGRAAPTARLEALLANDLDWDVMQLTRP